MDPLARRVRAPRCWILWLFAYCRHRDDIGGLASDRRGHSIPTRAGWSRDALAEEVAGAARLMVPPQAEVDGPVIAHGLSKSGFQ